MPSRTFSNKLGWDFISLVLAGIAIFIFGGYLQLFWELPMTQAAASVSWKSISIIPARVSISSAGINIPVKSGGIIDGEWILDSNSALFFPLESGKKTSSLVIYAHNTHNLFANLKTVKVGDFITVKDINGKSHDYRVYSKENINPTQVDKIIVPADGELVMFTCNGWFDSQRLLVKAASITPRQAAVF